MSIEKLTLIVLALFVGVMAIGALAVLEAALSVAGAM
jgi:hypothetical protein